MNFNLELRYYELLFKKTIIHYNATIGLDHLYELVDLMCLVSGADTKHMQSALRLVLIYDKRLDAMQSEYIICLLECGNMNARQVAKKLGCAHRTIQQAQRQYKEGQLHIRPRLDIEVSHEVRKAMQAVRMIGDIF